MNQPATRSIVDPAKWLQEQRERIAAMRERAGRASAELREASVSTTSQERAVTVTVNPGGVLLGLRLGPQAEDMGRNQLAAQIMTTYRAACAEAAELTRDIMSDLVGEDSPALEFLRDALPSDMDDDDDDDDDDADRGR